MRWYLPRRRSGHDLHEFLIQDKNLVVWEVVRYTYLMETIVRNVRDLHDSERSAAEQLVGHRLRENQQLVINVLSVDVGTNSPATGATNNALPAWCNVYDGLTDDEIAELEKSILTRADLSRPSE